MVGGPGFEPGASRSRTVLVVCPRVSSGVRDGPPLPKFRRLSVLLCPPVTACDRLFPGMCDPAVTRRVPQKGGDPRPPRTYRKCLLHGHVLTRSECVDLVGRSLHNANHLTVPGIRISLGSDGSNSASRHRQRSLRKGQLRPPHLPRGTGHRRAGYHEFCDCMPGTRRVLIKRSSRYSTRLPPR
jgi:hypothetical protein